MFKRFRCKVPMNLQKFAEGGSGDGGAAGASGADGGTSPAGAQQKEGIRHGIKLCRTVEPGAP